MIFQPVSDGAVLLDTSGEVYFGLNAVGAFVWQRLPPVHETLDTLCAELEREYPEIDQEVLRTDVREMIEDLLTYGLVKLQPGSVGNVREPASVPGA